MINFLKEEISHLRFWLGVYVAIALTLGSWIVSHLTVNFKFLLACLAEIIVLIKIYFINNTIKSKIEKIGEYNGK